LLINTRECRKGNKKMDNAEKLATHNAICIGHHYTQTNTNNVNLQTIGGKGEPNLVFMRNRNGHHNTELRT
jgi:hypothetical protein